MPKLKLKQPAQELLNTIKAEMVKSKYREHLAAMSEMVHNAMVAAKGNEKIVESTDGEGEVQELPEE